ncbi:MAG: hypothetical protein M5R36_13165 [Deltaproteobacteria bacterium]|nr:hypothetical protein [Deltaproteobacteria bacterium]
MHELRDEKSVQVVAAVLRPGSADNEARRAEGDRTELGDAGQRFHDADRVAAGAGHGFEFFLGKRLFGDIHRFATSRHGDFLQRRGVGRGGELDLDFDFAAGNRYVPLGALEVE